MCVFDHSRSFIFDFLNSFAAVLCFVNDIFELHDLNFISVVFSIFFRDFFESFSKVHPVRRSFLQQQLLLLEKAS